MYRQFGWVIIAFFFSSSMYATRILLDVQVEAAVEKKLSFIFPGPEFSSMGSGPIYRIALDESGKSIFELPLEQSTVVDFEYNGNVFPLFLRPGERLGITFQADNMLETIRFSGEESNENAWMRDFLMTDSFLEKMLWEEGFWPIQVEKWAYSRASDLAIDTYFNLVAERKSKRLDLLNTQLIELHPDFVRYYQFEFEYRSHTQKLMWYLMHLGQLAQADLRQLKKEFKPLRGVALGLDLGQERQVFQDFLHAYILYEYAPNKSYINGLVASELYFLADEKLKERSRDFIQSSIMLRLYEKTADATFGQRYFQGFQNTVTYESYVSAILKSYGADLAILDNNYAPEFEVFTKDGDMLRLADFRNQVVYISFWASWCKPCYKNFDKSRTLREDLYEMGVVLLNVSIDESEADFQKALEKHDIFGLNVLAYRLDDVKLNYQLSTIPAYYIVDKEGKLAFLSNAGGRDILEEFKKLVEK